MLRCGSTPGELQADHNFLLEKQRAVYFFIPKVACSSLKLFFLNLLELPMPNTERLHSARFPRLSLVDIDEDRVSNLFRFCFVRNPFTRLVSAYKSMVCRDKDDEYYRGGVFRDLNKYGGFSHRMPFEGFVERVCDIPDKHSDPHFRTQSDFVMNSGGRVEMDFIGRFENLESDFARLCDRLNITKTELKYLNSTDDVEFKEHYTESIADKVIARYRKDFDNFKYSTSFSD